MANDSVDREDINLIRRIDQVEAKMDRLALSLDHLAEQSRAGVDHIAEQLHNAIESIVSRQEDRLKLIEQRMDMGVREQQQSISLLTATVSKHEQQQSSIETQMSLLGTEQVLFKAGLNKVEDNLQWISRAVIGMLISAIGSLIVGSIIYLATH